MTAERRIETEIEVPGTPEEVWEAIATGPGVTAWFVPTEIEPRVGGSYAHDHGAGFEETGTITAYDPPHRLRYEDAPFHPEGDAAGARVLATEYLVEARGGGTCVVRVVTSGMGDGDEWDAAVESFTTGWRRALADLRVYRQRFPGERAATILAGGPAAPGASAAAAWDALAEAVGIPARPAVGERVRSRDGGPALAGEVVEAGDAGAVTIVLDEPGPGLAWLGTGGPGSQVFRFARIRLYGDGAEEVAARERPAWQALLDGVGAAG